MRITTYVDYTPSSIGVDSVYLTAAAMRAMRVGDVGDVGGVKWRCAFRSVSRTHYAAEHSQGLCRTLRGKGGRRGCVCEARKGCCCCRSASSVATSLWASGDVRRRCAAMRVDVWRGDVSCVIFDRVIQ
jgi:hypothetical protein